jgi:hypothetical protein
LSIETENAAQKYWVLKQKIQTIEYQFCSNSDLTDDIRENCEKRVAAETELFGETGGFGFFVFNGTVLPGFLTGFGTSLIAFYVAVVYVVS